MQQAVDPTRDEDRINTGPLQFPGDWPGFFIRGDDALGRADLGEALVRAYREGKADGERLCRFIEDNIIEPYTTVMVGEP